MGVLNVQRCKKVFATTNRHFYMDMHQNSYNEGIYGISNNIEESIEYLKREISKYKTVIFVGVSSGGYAAILFGSILNVTYVVAFTPQTIRYNDNIDEKYRDISQYINNTTKYYLYGDLSATDDYHKVYHCDRIVNPSNVFLTKKPILDLKKMRDDGELFFIFDTLLYKPKKPIKYNMSKMHFVERGTFPL